MPQRQFVGDGPDTRRIIKSVIDDNLQKYNNELTKALRGMGGLSPEERPIIGKLVNEVRDLLEEEFAQKEKHLKAEELQKKLETENIDVTEPSKKINLGSIHPITQIIKEVEEIFLGMGYQIADGPEVEKTFYNFDQLTFISRQ